MPLGGRTVKAPSAQMAAKAPSVAWILARYARESGRGPLRISRRAAYFVGLYVASIVQGRGTGCQANGVKHTYET